MVMRMLYAKIIFMTGIFCILMQPSGCKRNVYLETEPNNSFQNANEISFDKPVEGYINNNNDIDVFKMTIAEKSIVSLHLSSVKGINHAIKFIKQTTSGHTLLKLIDDTRKSSPESMANMGFEPGIYYIQVLHGDRDAKKGRDDIPYTLTLTKRAMEQEEFEPNDSAGQENKIEIGQTYKGYFSPAFNKLNRSKEAPLREEDRFVFYAEGRPDAPFVVDINVSGVPGINSELALLNPAGEKISVINTNGTGEGESLKGLGLTSAGKYSIVIYSNNYQVNATTPYELEVTQQDYDPTMEMESNNSFEKANLLTQNSVKGRIPGEADRDYFVYQYSGEPTLVNFVLDPPLNMDITMTIFDAMKNELYKIDNQGAGGREIFPGLYLTASCYICITAKPGSYDPDSMYHLLLDTIPYNNVFETEPNDTLKTASQVVDTIVKGYLTQRKDKDYFLLTFNKRIRKQVTVQGMENAEFDVSITDQLGYIIKTVSVVGDEPVTFSEMIDGKAYILVEAKTGPQIEPYTIEIGDIE